VQITANQKNEEGVFELPVTWIGSNQEDFWTTIYAFDNKQDAISFSNGLTSSVGGDDGKEWWGCCSEEDMKLYNNGRKVASDKIGTGYVPKVFIL